MSDPGWPVCVGPSEGPRLCGTLLGGRLALDERSGAWRLLIGISVLGADGSTRAPQLRNQRIFLGRPTKPWTADVKVSKPPVTVPAGLMATGLVNSEPTTNTVKVPFGARRKPRSVGAKKKLPAIFPAGS